MNVPRNPYEAPAAEAVEPEWLAAADYVPRHFRLDVYLTLAWCLLGLAWIWCGGHEAFGRLHHQASYGLFGYFELESQSGLIIKSIFYPELFGLSLALSAALVGLSTWQVRSMFR